MNKIFLKTPFSGVLFGAAAGCGFLFGNLVLSANPGVTGEVGVPQNGYIFEILQNKLLVNGNLNTTDGKVSNSDRLDNIPANSYQKAITGSCPVGEWAVGINPDASIKCRAN